MAIAIPVPGKSDKSLWLVVGVCSLISLMSLGYFLTQNLVTTYGDGLSHLFIAKRMLESATPGFAQAGAVWLPLPHVLMLTTIWNDNMYYSGLSGSIISMISFVIASVFIYKIALVLTEKKSAGVVAALVFALNPNVLYMQAVPMTELPLMMFMAMGTYFLVKWAIAKNMSPKKELVYLAVMGIAAAGASLTRYEGWVFTLALAVGVAYTGFRRSWSRSEIFSKVLLYFGFWPGAAIGGWVVWNLVIFGDPMYFTSGEYAKPSLWVTNTDPAIGNWSVSFQTYGYAILDNIGPLMVALAAVGLFVYLLRTRLAPHALSPVTLLVYLPFFVYMLYAGQRPLHVEEISGDLNNVRFGLVMILPVAIFASYSVVIFRNSRLQWSLGALIILAAAASSLSAYKQENVVTLNDPLFLTQKAAYQRMDLTGSWLRDHYDGGRLLMEHFGNEVIFSRSHVPPRKLIWEGSFEIWDPALVDPVGENITWIHMRVIPGFEDKVWKALHGSDMFTRCYSLVYKSIDSEVYKFSGCKEG